MWKERKANLIQFQLLGSTSFVKKMVIGRSHVSFGCDHFGEKFISTHISDHQLSL